MSCAGSVREIRSICLWCVPCVLLYCCCAVFVCLRVRQSASARASIFYGRLPLHRIYFQLSFRWQINPILLLHIHFFPSPFSLLFCFYYWIVVIFVVLFFLSSFLFIFLFRLVRMKEMHINKANGKSLRYLFILLCLCVIIIFIMHWTHAELRRLPADWPLMWPSPRVGKWDNKVETDENNK